jgi:leucyl-tRNA synthetase
MKYNPSKIEKKWQKRWGTSKLYDAQKGPGHMLLTEFPYPSGNLHIGHWYAFALPDILARYLRMNGKNVMYPIGFDAFGLPAENAAIKNKVHPGDWTRKNILYMTKQLKSMGAVFDWSREVRTIDPDYYKWTQWMFLKFFEKGLAYRASTMVNWCPKDLTVLANEQVVDGCCERCGTAVIQKELAQWMFRITRFADNLIDDMESLDWPETTKLAQKNWIGRSEGTRIKFNLCVVGQPDGKHSVEVFTTRADTLFGVTAIVVSPELARKWIDVGWNANVDIKKYISLSLGKSELQRQETVKEKTGIASEVDAVHPLTGEKVPVWIADYVLGHYGTGAVMMVPAHDQRDYEFAGKYNLAIKEVIKVPDAQPGKASEEYGILINSEKFDGLSSEEAKKKITQELKAKGMGEFQKTYRLHDWILSRQRYWGVPIPVINCQSCGYQPVSEKELPVKLPPLKNFKPANDGRSPLAKAKDWLKVKCPKCGRPAERETDTMDTFVDSSWYFMRYADPDNKKEFASVKKMSDWLPVPMYIGGAEHNTMHLLYSRFFTKALHELGFVDFKEPFTGRRNHGTILGPDNQKMSKSRGNVVDPDIEVKKYGADAVRMYLSFMGPYEQGGPWSPGGISGVYRFLNRVWYYIGRYDKKTRPNPEAVRIINKYIKEIGDDIKSMSFNTGVSGLMKLLNDLESHTISKNEYETFLKLLAPFAPHLTEELWQSVLKNKRSIHIEKWPEYDQKMLAEEKINLVVQVNGRVRDTLSVNKGLSEDEARKLAVSSDYVKKHLTGDIKKIIYVKDRVINLVI